MLADFVNGADVGVIQRGRRTAFPTEAFKRLRGFAKVVGKKFQGNSAAKFGVLGLVNHTHSAATKLFDDAVVRDGLADERLGLRHLASMLSCEYGTSQRTRRICV